MNPPSRRVLGQKDTNAHLSTRSPEKNNSTVTSAPVKPTPKQLSEMPESSSPIAGTKRKIHEVEDAERIDPGPQQDSQQTQLLSDTESDDEYRQNDPGSHQQTSYETANTSLPASQICIEPQFEFPQDEMSQRTLEKLNDVPMPQNTSQLPPSQPRLLNEMSAGSVGLSHFFNFEGPPSTQNSDQPDLIEFVEKPPTSTMNPPNHNNRMIAESEAARKRMLEEKAEQLRTRLQLAMFKVQTKQTNQPFSRLKCLKVNNRERSVSPPTLPTPHFATPTLSSSTVKQPSSVRTIGPRDQSYLINSAEEHIAAMRARAANQQKPPVRNLNSLPMPRLDPQLVNPSDSFATQLIDDGSQHFPSSPPLSRQSSNASTDLVTMESETQAKQIAGAQLSSPPVSESDLVARDSSNLTTMANAVMATQGEAASGLVKLMTAE